MQKNIKIKNSIKNITFRHDIETLRGFSVLLVLLYHFDFNIFKSNFINSGYIGVDIFFIISGYVITKIILEKENFSIINFYLKRIKRLIPVLLIVLTVSIIAAYFIFDDFILKKNLNSTYSIILGLSNYFFWLTSTIYQFAEKNNMLFLHTWSLGIEFQFYLFFPFVLFILGKKIIKFFLIIIFLLSYISIFYFYETHNMFNFYSPSSRIFEISSGCLAYLFQKKIKENIKEKFEIYFYLFGFLLILIFMIFFHNEDFHPNPQSLIFVIGTCFVLIFYKNNLDIFYKLQINKIGTISYSLYLWHFPIIVLSNHFISDLNDFDKFLMLISCFVLSILSFKFVEKKFRELNFRKNLILIFSLLFLLMFISLKINHKTYENNLYIFDNYYLSNESNKFLRNKDKFSFRKNKNIFSFQNDYKKYSPSFSNLNNKKILFLGDSHSKDIFNLFYTHKHYYKNYEFARYGINLIDLKNQRLNYLINSDLFIKSNIILFSQRYKNKDIDYISKLIEISKLHNKKLVLILKKPEFIKNDKLNKSFLDNHIKNINNLNKLELDKFAYQNLKKSNFVEINEKIREKYFGKIKLVDLYSLICSEVRETCEIVNNKLTKNFYDYGHFTLEGSKYFGDKIIQKNFYDNLIN